MQKNVIYLCCLANPWIDIAKRLHNSLGLSPSYVVCWRSDYCDYKNAKFENCHLQLIEDAWKGLNFPNEVKPVALDEEQINKISWYELVALKMMDRLDPCGDFFPFSARQYFFHDLIAYWQGVISSKNIKLVVSPSIPHRVFDYALYVVCKLNNIHFLSFKMTPFGSNSVIVDDINSLPSYVNNSISNVSVPSKEIFDRIKRVNGEYTEAIPDYMLNHHQVSQKSILQNLLHKISSRNFKTNLKKFCTQNPNTYWVRKGALPSESFYTWIDLYKTKFCRYKKIKKLEKAYDLLVEPLPRSPFVLLALHYQPEETSCPTGGSYADQILVAQILDECLPGNISIVIKEHKSQFYTHTESSSGRDLMFYRRLSQISNRIHFVSVDFDPFELIDKAMATITISGTIGWESAIRGTPSIIFGCTWYENMPGVFKVKSKNEFLNAWHEISSKKYNYTGDDIIKFHANLEQYFIRAKHYKSYLKNEDVDIEQTVDNIYHGIAWHLERKSVANNVHKFDRL